jgi:hypothetical protein
MTTMSAKLKLSFENLPVEAEKRYRGGGGGGGGGIRGNSSEEGTARWDAASGRIPDLSCRDVGCVASIFPDGDM